MEGDNSSKRRRGPPDSKRRRSPPSQPTAEPAPQEEEWYDDVVDRSEIEDGGFGGFAVKRPQMSTTDQVEGQQLERYFEKQYHKKQSQQSESIEDHWDEDEPEFNIASIFNGYKTLVFGIQSFMIALPTLLLSIALVWGGQSLMDSMGDSTGAFLNIFMTFVAICLTSIAFIQILVSAVNQSLRERQIAKDGADIPLLGWSSSLQMSSKLFSEVLLTFMAVWSLQILGLYLLANAMPDMTLPSIDPDNISVGTVLYILGAAGSLFVIIGMIPYTIEATIKRS